MMVPFDKIVGTYESIHLFHMFKLFSLDCHDSAVRTADVVAQRV